MQRCCSVLYMLLLIYLDGALSFSTYDNLASENGELNLSRRSAIASIGACIGSLVVPRSVYADESTTPSLSETRSNLLKAIEFNQSEEEVLKAIEQLIPLDPSQGRGATFPNDLSGEWKLLWSIKADAFSPLLQLPRPFKPDSYQYLGDSAAEEVGSDRVAQGLTGGILGRNTQLWLSSGVAPSPQDDSVLEIFPPFRFQIGGPYRSGRPKTTLVDAGSDAEFRQLNARTREAQKAPKNSYQQLYLERDGPGSLRISTVADGDPVIVGAMFVHQKL